jgi:hypothetical protein
VVRVTPASCDAKDGPGHGEGAVNKKFMYDINLLPYEILTRITVTENGCWLWNTGGTPDGYGTCYYKHKNWRAHRIVYKILVGPIPFLKDLHHKLESCSKRCCNPEHVEVVSHRHHPGGSMYRDKTRCVNGHELTPDNVRVYKRRRGSGLVRQCKVCCYNNTKRYRTNARNNITV